MTQWRKILTFVGLSLVSVWVSGQVVSQWRGINRDGIYDEKGLLKTWPEKGPSLLWKYDQLGCGFGSPTITTDRIYINGIIDSVAYLYVLDLKGNLIQRIPYGSEFVGQDYAANFPGGRSAPTVCNDYVYVSSGNGSIACIDPSSGTKVWSVDMIRDFQGVKDQHGYCESLLVDSSKVYCLPGGSVNNVVALNRFTGKTIWTTKAMGDSATYCSPMMINLPSRNLLVTFSGHYLLGIDAATGELLWSKRQRIHRYHQHCNTPIYSEGNLYYLSWEGNGLLKFELSPDGSSIKELWRTDKVDNVYNGFVKLGDYIFAPDKAQKMKCADTRTGIVVDSIRIGKGATIATADQLYCYGENGNVSLVNLSGTKMELSGKFTITDGTKEHFSHPVISQGILYIRRGNTLMAFDIKE